MNYLSIGLLLLGSVLVASSAVFRSKHATSTIVGMTLCLMGLVAAPANTFESRLAWPVLLAAALIGSLGVSRSTWRRHSLEVGLAVGSIGSIWVAAISMEASPRLAWSAAAATAFFVASFIVVASLRLFRITRASSPRL